MEEEQCGASSAAFLDYSNCHAGVQPDSSRDSIRVTVVSIKKVRDELHSAFRTL